MANPPKIPTQTGKERVFCSQLSPDSSMLGTADPVDIWLFLEFKPSWPAQAIADGGLSEPIQHWLEDIKQSAADQGLKLRPQLVRQPEIDSERTRLLVAGSGQLATFDGQGYDFLLELELKDLLQGVVPAAPLYFVCTNGKRDLCCARFGLPIYQGLRELVGDRVWQVTHLGGHRFAPNVLVVPDNLLYGRVQPEQVPTFVQSVEAGLVDFSHLRGRSCYSQPVQAAEGLLAKQQLQFVEAMGDDSATDQALSVSFTDGQKQHNIRVQRQAEPEQILAGCDKPATKAVYPFRKR